MTSPLQASTSGNAPDSASSMRAWHIAILLLVGMLWGVQPALIKYSLGGGLTEIETLALVMIAVVFCTGAYLKTCGRLVWPRRDLAPFVTVAGFAEYAAPLMMTFAVAPHIDAALLTLVVATTPLFTVVLAAIFRVEPLRWETAAACVLGLLALAAMAIPETALPSREMLPWCLAAFAIPILYSSGSLYVSKNWPDGLDAIQVAFLGSFAAMLMLSPFSLKAIASGAVLGHPAASYGVLAVLVATLVLEMMLYFYLLQNAGPVFTSFSSFVMIVSGFIAGMTIFGERPSGWIWLSVGLFVLSLALVFRPPAQATGKAAA